jgi:hypothetical protein
VPARSPTKILARLQNKFASRKFSLTCVVWAVGTIGWAYGYLAYGGALIMTTEEWIKFSTWIIGLYMTGNVADKAFSKDQTTPES